MADDRDDQPVSRFFPVLTESRREAIERQRQLNARINASRKAGARLAAEVMALLADEARRQTYIRDAA